MAGKGRSGRGGVCRRGHAEPCGRAVLDQENLPARWLSRAVLSCHSQRPSHHCAHHQRLVDRPSSRPRHPPASAGLHDLRPGRWRCCGGSKTVPMCGPWPATPGSRRPPATATTREVLEVIAQRSPGVTDVLDRLRRDGEPFVCLDGTLVRTGRVTARPQARNH